MSTRSNTRPSPREPRRSSNRRLHNQQGRSGWGGAYRRGGTPGPAEGAWSAACLLYWGCRKVNRGRRQRADRSSVSGAIRGRRGRHHGRGQRTRRRGGAPAAGGAGAPPPPRRARRARHHGRARALDARERVASCAAGASACATRSDSTSPWRSRARAAAGPPPPAPPPPRGIASGSSSSRERVAAALLPARAQRIVRGRDAPVDRACWQTHSAMPAAGTRSRARCARARARAIGAFVPHMPHAVARRVDVRARRAPAAVGARGDARAVAAASAQRRRRRRRGARPADVDVDDAREVDRVLRRAHVDVRTHARAAVLGQRGRAVAHARDDEPRGADPTRPSRAGQPGSATSVPGAGTTTSRCGTTRAARRAAPAPPGHRAGEPMPAPPRRPRARAPPRPGRRARRS